MFAVRIVFGGMTLKHTWIAEIHSELIYLSRKISVPTEKGKTMAEMETKQIISWLRDKADRADNPSWTRMMKNAADRLDELDQKVERLDRQLRGNIFDKEEMNG